MVHVFLGEVRERYGLERLWRDAAEVPSAVLQGEPAKPRRAAPKRPRKAAAARPKAPRATKRGKKSAG